MRGAHCSCRRSSLYETNYLLREVGPFTDEIKRMYAAVRRNGPRPRVYCTWDRCRFDGWELSRD